MKIRRHLRLISLATIMVASVMAAITAAAQPIQWEKTFNRRDWDYPYSIVQTDDGGYAVAGVTSQSDGTTWTHNGHVVKFDGEGRMQWDRLTDAAATYTARGLVAILPWKNRGYMAVGHSSTPTTVSNLFLAVLDSDGAVVRADTIKEGDSLEVTSAIATADGGVFVVAMREWGNTLTSDLLIFKFDAGARLEWSRTYSGESFIYSAAATQMSDGSYAIATYIKPKGGVIGMSIRRISYQGSTMWESSSFTNQNGYLRSIIPAADGGLLVAFVSYDATYINTLSVVKVGRDGQREWSRSYPEIAPENPGFVLVGMVGNASGGFSIAGMVRNDPALLHIDAGGERAGFTVYPHAADPLRRMGAIAPTSDGGLILTGATSDGNFGTDLLLIKIGSGVSGVGEHRHAAPGVLRLY